jgi:potassium channel subfamily K
VKIQKYSSLGTSFFAYVVVWLGGALVFWFSEHVRVFIFRCSPHADIDKRLKKLQSWTYFESLYFAYTTLLTIGYGDFFPKSNSGKPFFVIWSLIAVPTVTVLISNMGDTVVGWLKEGTLWIGERTILPERVRRRRASESQEPQAGVAKEKRKDTKDGKTEGAVGLGKDVERLGEAVEHAEEDQGRKGSLAAKIAKEISGVAKDVGKRPPKKYKWHEWAAWVDLLDMGDKSKPQGTGKRPSKEGIDWTWLGDDGPLLSGVTETEWVLGKLCNKLEEVLEKELEAAHKHSS